MKKIFIVLSLAFLLCLPVVVSADTFGSGLLNRSVKGVGLESNLETGVARVISTVTVVVGTIFLLLTVAAGVIWMTASGEEKKVETAKNILKAAVIGLVIVVCAYTITFFVTNRLKGAASGTTETVGCCSWGFNGIYYGDTTEEYCFDTHGEDSPSWQAGACDPNRAGLK